jgi:hypothetical protein
MSQIFLFFHSTVSDIPIFPFNNRRYSYFSIQQIMNSCDFRDIIVVKDFEIENGVLGFNRDVYLSVVKFLDSSILRKV